MYATRTIKRLWLLHSHDVDVPAKAHMPLPRLSRRRLDIWGRGRAANGGLTDVIDGSPDKVPQNPGQVGVRCVPMWGYLSVSDSDSMLLSTRTKNQSDELR